MSTVIIAGSRSLVDIEVVERLIEESGLEITEVVHGDAYGVDKIAAAWGKRKGLIVTPFPAKWKDLSVPGAVMKVGKYGPYNVLAGFMRNRSMAEYVKEKNGTLLAVWDGASPGTKHMIDTAHEIGLPVCIFKEIS
jgi:hypothetical protein